MIVGVPDKILKKWLGDKEYIICSDEGEAVGIGAGYWYATKKTPTVFMSADGFCNAMNPLTSLVIPEKIPMKLVISTGRQEPQHKVMSDILERIINLFGYVPNKLHIQIIK
jgi:phosphonopyruvate decarboxylase